MQRKVLIDLDDVVVNFVDAACVVHGRENPYVTNPSNLGNYHLEEILGLTKSQFWKPMTYDFWLNLSLMDQGKRLINIVEAYVPKKYICFATSPSSNDGCAQGKIDWIKKHYHRFSRSFAIGPMKYMYAGPNTVLIDDSQKNIDAFIEEGGIGYLFPSRTNKRYAEVGEEHIWLEIVDLIK